MSNVPLANASVSSLRSACWSSFGQCTIRKTHSLEGIAAALAPPTTLTLSPTSEKTGDEIADCGADGGWSVGERALTAVAAEKEEMRERADDVACAASAAFFCCTMNAAATKGSLGSADSLLGSEKEGHAGATDAAVKSGAAELDAVSGERSGRF